MTFGKQLDDPIAYGGTAEIYAGADNQILKLFHEGVSSETVAYEANVTRAVAELGIPVPAVGEMVTYDGRYGILYERLDGMTLFAAMQRYPLNLFKYARLLADLQLQMHTAVVRSDVLPRLHQRLASKIEAAPGLSDALRQRCIRVLAGMPIGTSLCHGDFHPGNILLTSKGPRIIDWIDVAIGHPLADVARSSILIRGVMVWPIARWQKLIVRVYHRAYVRRYLQTRADRALLPRWEPIVAAGRLSEQIEQLEPWLLQEVASALRRTGA